MRLRQRSIQRRVSAPGPYPCGAQRLGRPARVADPRLRRTLTRMRRLFRCSSSGNLSALRAGMGAGALTRRGGLARAPGCARPRRGTPQAALRGPGVILSATPRREVRPASSERGTTRGDGLPTVKRGHCGEVQRDHRLHGRQRARHRRDRTRPARIRAARLATSDPRAGRWFRFSAELVYPWRVRQQSRPLPLQGLCGL